MDVNGIHRRMTKNVFLNTELLLNDCIREISEFDIQSYMFLHFRRQLIHTIYRVDREKEGKVDCVLYKNNKPYVYYEIKTYFKDNEKLKKEHFDKDIKKIRDVLSKNRKARGYLFIAAKKSKFSEDVIKDFDFIKVRLKEGKKCWTDYLLPSNETVRLRPSIKERYGQSTVITWEIKIK